MPRQHRIISSTGIYHIYNRGLGKMIIFEDDNDRKKFINYLKQKSKVYCVDLIAYCLMPNHYHLLILDNYKNLSVFMQSLVVSYAKYFNRKYHRFGILFQDRFQSRCVENTKYFTAVLRYILQNPEKADIARTSEYKWSSYSDYIRGQGICNTKLINDAFGNKHNYIEFLSKTTTAEESIMIKDKMLDDDIVGLANNVITCDNCTNIQYLCYEKRNEELRRLKNAGLSGVQISRVTGIGLNIVYRAIKPRGKTCINANSSPTPN